MLSKLSAENAVWDTLSRSWKLYDYYHRTFDERGIQTITQGAQMDTLINLTYEDLSTRANVVETLSFHELNDMIAIQRRRGDKMVKFDPDRETYQAGSPFCSNNPYNYGCLLVIQKEKGRNRYEHRNRDSTKLFVYSLLTLQPDVCSLRSTASACCIVGAEYALWCSCLFTLQNST